MIGFRSSDISGYGAKLQECISFQGSLPVAAGCYRTCISQVAIRAGTARLCGQTARMELTLGAGAFTPALVMIVGSRAILDNATVGIGWQPIDKRP
jgi:hypothetical protein